MKKTFLAIVVLIIALSAYFLFWPIPIEPVVWTPSPNPGSTGEFAGKSGFNSLENLVRDVGLGPEDVTMGSDGYFYTGLQDGRIIRFKPEDSGAGELFVNTGGRPLGMKMDAQGNLVVCDAFKGLISVAPDRKITVLVESVGGKKMLFPDDLDIAKDGTIWFSDASQRFDQRHWINDFWEGRPTGRLLSYDPKTKETKVILGDLLFANGVALGPDEAFVLVNETLAARIVRYWLKGPKAGTRDLFIAGLPGYNDNLSFNGNGIFWVALPAPRNNSLEGLAGSPFQRGLVFRLPNRLKAVVPEKVGWVIGLDADGKVKYNLQDSSGLYTNITSVNEFVGHLNLGSIEMHSVWRAKLP